MCVPKAVDVGCNDRLQDLALDFVYVCNIRDSLRDNLRESVNPAQSGISSLAETTYFGLLGGIKIKSAKMCD